MKQTAKILTKLLTDGEINSRDVELLADYRTPEVRAELDIWGEEMGFSLLDINGAVYLIPHADSELLSFSLRDIRESDSKTDRLVEAFLECYIIMTILWLFYGGKNNNPKRVPFLQVKDIVEELDRRFSDAEKTFTPMMEETYEINFSHIAVAWDAMQTYDDQKRKTRTGIVLKACRLMKNQKLLEILDDNREIRPRERLDDLMMGYYLDNRRIGEIHALFDKLKLK